MAQSSDGTKAFALGLCREYEDKFLEHIAGGEVSKSNAVPAGLYISLRFIHSLRFTFLKSKGY